MTLLASVDFAAPKLDYHALGTEIVLVGGLALILLIDLFLPERKKWQTGTLAGLVLLGALIPSITLALDGAERSMVGGAYVVDHFSLVFRILIILAAYVVVLLSTTYVEEGDYYQGEYYFLLLSSVLGMVTMASSRDLISIFVSLELLSIPAYLLAGWRKRDPESNEASLKYYLLGVVASGIMLYGMSMIFGITGSTLLADIAEKLAGTSTEPLVVLSVFLILVGFAFKVSAVPFHQWAPDTYQGAPTPITAFLSVASKTAGFVALLQLVFIAFPSEGKVFGPMFFVLAMLTMTVGNLIALRQSNVVRMLAYSSIAQAGYILVPFAVAGSKASVSETSIKAVVVYLVTYAVMTLGAFAVVITVARRTRSGEISSFAGLFKNSPVLAVVMTVFLGSLVGIPPLAGWFGKLYVVTSIMDAANTTSVLLGVFVAVNTAIAAFYYLRIAREMWFEEPTGELLGDPIVIPPNLGAALTLCVAGVLVFGIFPGIVGRIGELALGG